MINIYTHGKQIWMFSRTPDGKQVIKKVNNFNPYFYVLDSTGDCISIFGDKCRKVVVDNPFEVAQQRTKYTKTFEADVHYPNRFIIDHFDGVIPENPIRYQFIDLEMATRTKALPNVKDPTDPVVSNCVYDSFDNRYYIFCWCDTIKKFYQQERTVQTGGEDKEIQIFYCSSEEEMFNFFLEFEKATRPDMWLAWNGWNFDYPYMFNRYTIDVMEDISPIGKAGFDGRGFYLAGVALMDFMEMYKHVTIPSGQKESYSLDYIAKIELGRGKAVTSWDYINEDVWRNHFEELIMYNFVDVDVMVGIEKKRKIIKNFDTIRRVSKSRFDDVFHNSVVVDNTFLSFSKNKWVLPTRAKTEKEDVKGGRVKEPEKGLHFNVGAFDATALYPSLIITFNLSPDALDPNGEININGVRFRKEPLGIFPMVCSYLQETRDMFKKEMEKYELGSSEYDTYDLLQTSVKYVNNSVFGIAGFPGSRFYSPDVANSITYLGREFTTWVGDIAEKKGYKFMYSDTDSIWINLGGKDLKECVDEGKEFQKMVNSRLVEFTKPYGADKSIISLKFEKIYTSLYFGGKKRYCGILRWKEGLDCDVVEFKGFEARRSDTPLVAKEFQKKFFKLILDSKTKEEVDVFVNNFIKELEKKPIEEVGFPVGTKTLDSYESEPIHIRAMRYSMDTKIDVFYPGEKIKYIFVKRVPSGYPGTNVIAFKDKFPSGFDVDWDKVINRLVWMKIHPVYRNLGWRVDDSRQLKLVSLF